MKVLQSLEEYDREFFPEVYIDGTVFFRGKVHDVKPQERAHNRARELGHGFYFAYNSAFGSKDSYAFGSFKDYGEFQTFFDRQAKGAQKLCRFFEQMVDKSKFYLDVDIEPFPDTFTGTELIQTIHSAVKEVFSRVYGQDVNMSDWRITDSSKPGYKMSYHMILCNNGCFADAHTHMFTFFHLVVDEFMKVAPGTMTDGGRTCPLDKGVYTINRNFRLVHNVKHKNVTRPLLKLEGQDFPDHEYAATVCENEPLLDQDVVYRFIERLSSRTHAVARRMPERSTGDRRAKAAKVDSSRNCVSLAFMHGPKVNPLDMLLFEYDKIDIENMTGGVGPAFSNVSMVSTFLGNPVKQVDFARPFVAGYSFDFDRKKPCFFCGGNHENNHVWVMYDSHLNRYMKQHSTNCIDRVTLIPYSPRGLRMWQIHYEQKVWTKPSETQRKALNVLFATTMRVTQEKIGPMWLTPSGQAVFVDSRPLQLSHPRTYYFAQVDDPCPPHNLYTSQKPWSFGDRTLVCVMRDDAYSVCFKKVSSNV
jgi:hypothetical protein